VDKPGELLKPLGRPRSSTKYKRPTLQPIVMKSSHSMVREQRSTASSSTTRPRSVDKSPPEQPLRQYRGQPLGTNEPSTWAGSSITGTSHNSRSHEDGLAQVPPQQAQYIGRGESDQPRISLLVKSNDRISASLNSDSTGSTHEVNETIALTAAQQMSSFGHDRTVRGSSNDVFPGGNHDQASTPLARANVHSPADGIPILELDPGQNIPLNDHLTNHVIIFDGGQSCYRCQTVDLGAGEAESREARVCRCNPRPCPRLLFAAIITQAIFNLCEITKAIGVMTEAACDLLNLAPISRPPQAKLAWCSHPALGDALLYPKLFVRTRVQFGGVQHKSGRIFVVPGNDPVIIFDWTAMQAETQMALPSHLQAASAFQVQPAQLPVVDDQTITAIDPSLISDIQQPRLEIDNSLLLTDVGPPAPLEELPDLSYMTTTWSDYSITYTDDVPNCSAISSTALACGAGLQMPKMDLAGICSADEGNPTFTLALTEANDRLSSAVVQPVDLAYTFMPLDTSTVHLFQASPHEAFGDEQLYPAFPTAIAHGDGVADESRTADDEDEEADFISVLSPAMRNLRSGYIVDDSAFDNSFS
jgi:hypothetical protein